MAKTSVAKNKTNTLEEVCDRLLETLTNVRKSDYRLNLIAAAPGSGSGWIRITIPMITGRFLELEEMPNLTTLLYTRNSIYMEMFLCSNYSW